MTPEIEAVQWLRMSRQRTQVLIALSKHPRMPRELEKELGIKLSRLSKVLGQLKGRNLVKSLTPRMARYRLYDITPQGRSLLAAVRETTRESSSSGIPSSTREPRPS